MAFLTYSDFASGKFRISQTIDSQTDLTAYITKYEKRYLQDLMGITMYNAFIASLSSNVPTGVYLTIYNPFAEDNENSGFVFQALDGSIRESVEAGVSLQPIVRSEGMKEMLKGFIYFEYTRDQPVKNTPNGNMQAEGENAISLSHLKAGIAEKYNEAVANYEAIQWYIREHSEDYPDFNGVKIDRQPFVI
jgi:hypothetical protein